MIVKLSHYFWIVLAYLLGGVGGGVVGGFLSLVMGYADGMGPWVVRILVGALLGSSLLSSAVVAKFASKKRVVAYYTGLTLALQVGIASIWWWTPMEDIAYILWFINPLIAYFLATRPYRLSPARA